MRRTQITALTCFGLAWVACDSVNRAFEQRENARANQAIVHDTVVELNKQLPKLAERVAQEKGKLTAITEEPSAIVYHVRLVDVLAAEVSPVHLNVRLRRPLLARFCASSGLQTLVEHRIGFRYRYSDRNGVPLTVVDIQGTDCPSAQKAPNPGHQADG